MYIVVLFLFFLSVTSTPQNMTIDPGGGNTTEGEATSMPQTPTIEPGGGNTTEEKLCSMQDVLNYLNLTKNNERYVMARPVKDYRNSTTVEVFVTLYAILDVIEKKQKFIPYIWLDVSWHNEYIRWNPDDFCGLGDVSVFTDVLWKPDLMIVEMIEKDKAPPTPYITISSNGQVYLKNDQVVVSTCEMQIYGFPFDIQTCNLTFSSIAYTGEYVLILPGPGSQYATQFSREVMRTQDEWTFINMTVVRNKAVRTWESDQVVYMITIKRNSIHYIVNFLLPVFFFLCLDLASFFISDMAGEKLGFKITVLLAVTVLQLIFNDILPATAKSVPLIVTYCIGIFSLMLLSLLETILVMHLLAKDSASQENEGDTGHSLRKDKEENKCIRCRCQCDTSSHDTTPELLTVAKEDSSTKLTGESHGLEGIAERLREVEKRLSLPLSSNGEGVKPGYWTRLAKRINRAFFIFYVISVSVFLITISVEWAGASQM